MSNDHSDDHDSREREALLHGIGVARGVLRRHTGSYGRGKHIAWAEKLLDGYQQELAAQWSITTDKPFADAEEREKRKHEILQALIDCGPIHSDYARLRAEEDNLKDEDLARTNYMREGKRWFEEITRAAVKQLARSWRK